MSTWGVEGGGVDEKRLDPLGLTCYGGSSNGKGFTYHVFDNKDFDVHLSKKDFDRVDKIYNLHLRKYKLKKINKLS